MNVIALMLIALIVMPIVIASNNGYEIREVVNTKRIVIKSYNSTTLSKVIKDLLSGKADIVYGLTYNDVVSIFGSVRALEKRGFKVIKTPDAILAIVLNTNSPNPNKVLSSLGIVETKEGVMFNPFAIREIRFALNYLINRQEFINKYLEGEGEPTYALANSYAERLIYPELFTKFNDSSLLS